MDSGKEIQHVFETSVGYTYRSYGVKAVAAGFSFTPPLEWARVQPLLPSSSGNAGRPFWDDHRGVEGVIYRYRSAEAGRVGRVRAVAEVISKRQRRYSVEGVWDAILAARLSEADDRGLVDWAVSVDLTINRSQQHAMNLPRDTGGAVKLHESAGRAA